jgi:subtilisin family serine protease
MLGPGAINLKRDDNGHGSAEAANVFATAPGVTFTMIKQGDNSTAAFKAAVALKPDIITCSWGFDLVDPASPNRQHLAAVPGTLKALELEVAHAVASGICVVFSAGNGHVSFPGMHPDVISAGGVFVDQNQDLSASDYASAFDSKPFPGRHVPDVCGLVGMQPEAIYIMLPLQPGCEIDKELASGKPFPDGDQTTKADGWSAISGTSAAAPQLAGICALLKQKRPSITPLEIKQALIASARDCTLGQANDASNEGTALKATPGIDGATGHGLVDAAGAVEIV